MIFLFIFRCATLNNIRFQAGVTDLSRLYSVPIDPETHAASYSMRSGSCFSGSKEIKKGVFKLTTHLHLVPILRMGGVIPPLPYMSSWSKYGNLYRLAVIEGRVAKEQERNV